MGKKKREDSGPSFHRAMCQEINCEECDPNPRRQMGAFEMYKMLRAEQFDPIDSSNIPRADFGVDSIREFIKKIEDSAKKTAGPVQWSYPQLLTEIVSDAQKES